MTRIQNERNQSPSFQELTADELRAVTGGCDDGSSGCCDGTSTCGCTCIDCCCTCGCAIEWPDLEPDIKTV